MIPMFKVGMSPDASQAVGEVLQSGMIGEGPKVIELAGRLSKLWHIHQDNVIMLNSCTSALALALKLANVGPGDRVASVPFTMVATNTAIKERYAEIVWMDIDSNTLCATYDSVKTALDSGVKAVVITLVGGIVYDDLHEIYGLCKYEKVPLILDCAHALCGSLKGEPLWMLCDFAAYSFQAIKHLCTGSDGGALIVKAPEACERAERLKWFGLSRKVPEGKTRLQHQMTVDLPEAGHKIHMSDFSASVGLANFDMAFENLRKSQANAEWYNKYLSLIPEIKTLLSGQDTDRSNISWWIYGFRAQRRDELIAYLLTKGIETTPMWRRNDEYTAFEKSPMPLPGMDTIAAEFIAIPSGFWVSEKDREYIRHEITNFYIGEK